ncbi:MAG: radical SAM protein [Phycisphaerales bacterium]|nr:radical SAM protein [Phycisphaerales bacterium]
MDGLARTAKRVTPAEHPHLSGMDDGLLDAVVAGTARLTHEQALDILQAMPTPALARWADARCRVLHGDRIRSYVIDRNINYTNVCTARCTFCAFRRGADDHDSYTLSYEAIHEKIGELVAIGGTQILMQGGMNPALPLTWYEGLLRSIKEKFPRVHVHAFSPPEFIEFVNFFDPPGATLEAKLRYVMERLVDAGLDSLPGGGGEIFAHPVRRKIGLGKCDAEAWLTTMWVAHSLGLFTSATMMFGHIEGLADRVHHMGLARAWQDRALAQQGPARGRHGREVGFGHYKAFISWPFQRENTPLGRLPDWGERSGDEGEFPGDIVARAFGFGANPEVDYRTLGPGAAEFGRRVRRSGAVNYLRTQALSRLMLDNFYSIGASWVTMGPHVGQAGLKFGASDMGSVMMEENVVSSAGTTYCLDEAVLCRLIRDAGFLPAQRDNVYDVLRVHDGPESPDLRVRDWSAHRARRLHTQNAASDAGLEVSSAPLAVTVSARAPDAAPVRST